MEQLHTSEEVFEALGGIPGVAELTSSRPKTVWYWQSIGSFPSNTYVIMTTALALEGKTAPASLWDMKTRAEAGESAA